MNERGDQPWYERGRDLAGRWLRHLRGGDGPRESARWLAYEVTVRAAHLNGAAAPGGLEAMSVQAMLTHARRALAEADDRHTAQAERGEQDRLELARLRAENAGLRALAPGSGQPRGAEHDPPAPVPELIEMADRIAGLSGDLDPAVARWLLERISAMLADLGVRSIREEGQVDPGRHDVRAVRSTGEPAHVGRIADTVRPGYVWRDRILRPQQVIAYVGEDQDR